MRCETFKVPNAVCNWAASGTLHYNGILYDIFTFLLMSCHDEELRLYNVTKEDDKTVTCWVASKGGEVCSL